MLEDAGECIAIFDSLPVQRRFGNEEMKQRVVGCGNRTPQACLPRLLALAVSQMLGLFQQIVYEGHRQAQAFSFRAACSDWLLNAK